jgi:hypothetical protein
MRVLLPSLLFSAALASPLVARAAKPIYWLLAGDSTTAANTGWGNSFLSSTVASGSTGDNYGHGGTTTASFRSKGDWAKVIKAIGTYKSDYAVYVTIQVIDAAFLVSMRYTNSLSLVTMIKKRDQVSLSKNTKPTS